MIFPGDHGTSEASAQNILNVGIKREFLPTTRQIGTGFYLAKMYGELPAWGTDWATQGARDKLYTFQRIVSYLTGERNNPLIGNNASARF